MSMTENDLNNIDYRQALREMSWGNLSKPFENLKRFNSGPSHSLFKWFIPKHIVGYCNLSCLLPDSQTFYWTKSV